MTAYIWAVFFDPETPQLPACISVPRAWPAGVSGSFAPDYSGACLGSAWALMESKLQLFLCLLIYTFGLWFNSASFTQIPDSTSCFAVPSHLCSLWDPPLYLSTVLSILAPGKNSCAGLDHLTHTSVLHPTVATNRLPGKIKNRTNASVISPLILPQLPAIFSWKDFLNLQWFFCGIDPCKYLGEHVSSLPSQCTLERTSLAGPLLAARQSSFFWLIWTWLLPVLLAGPSFLSWRNNQHLIPTHCLCN